MSQVISERHDLYGRVSDTSFMRFVHTHELAIQPQGLTCRVDVEPGEEAQTDDAEICLHFDPEEDRKRTRYAFIATRSHSPLKYVEFTYKHVQQSSMGSHVRMFEFCGGLATRFLTDYVSGRTMRSQL